MLKFVLLVVATVVVPSLAIQISSRPIFTNEEDPLPVFRPIFTNEEDPLPVFRPIFTNEEDPLPVFRPSFTNEEDPLPVNRPNFENAEDSACEICFNNLRSLTSALEEASAGRNEIVQGVQRPIFTNEEDPIKISFKPIFTNQEDPIISKRPIFTNPED